MKILLTRTGYRGQSRSRHAPALEAARMGRGLQGTTAALSEAVIAEGSGRDFGAASLDLL